MMLCTKPEKEAAERIAQSLYRRMPGAILLTNLDGREAWGEAGCTDHWAFCYAIAEAIVNNSASTFVDLD